MAGREERRRPAPRAPSGAAPSPRFHAHVHRCCTLLRAGGWEHVVVHRDHHRDEHDRVVEEVQLDARDPQLHDARRHRRCRRGSAAASPGPGAARARCDARTGSPSATSTTASCRHEARTQHPQPDEHHHRVAVVHAPRTSPARGSSSPRTPRDSRHRPTQHVNLEGLRQMLGPVGQDDDREAWRARSCPSALSR